LLYAGDNTVDSVGPSTDALRMNNPSRYLLSLFVALAVLAVMFTYWRTMVVHDFTIVNDLEEEDIGEESL